jgi:hypothetical protein
MPPSAEDCRAKASECAKLAAKTMDPFSKLVLEQTAEQWYVLAEGAEKYETLFASRLPGTHAMQQTTSSRNAHSCSK